MTTSPIEKGYHYQPDGSVSKDKHFIAENHLMSPSNRESKLTFASPDNQSEVNTLHQNKAYNRKNNHTIPSA